MKLLTQEHELLNVAENITSAVDQALLITIAKHVIAGNAVRAVIEIDRVEYVFGIESGAEFNLIGAYFFDEKENYLEYNVNGFPALMEALDIDDMSYPVLYHEEFDGDLQQECRWCVREIIKLRWKNFTNLSYTLETPIPMPELYKREVMPPLPSDHEFDWKYTERHAQMLSGLNLKQLWRLYLSRQAALRRIRNMISAEGDVEKRNRLSERRLLVQDQAWAIGELWAIRKSNSHERSSAPGG